MKEFMSLVFWSNSVSAYLIAFLVFIASIMVIKIAHYILIKYFKKLAEKTSTTFDDFLIKLIQKIVFPLACFGAVYISINALTLHVTAKKILDVLGVALLTLSAARFLNLFVIYGFKLYSVKRDQNKTLERSLDGILRVLNFIIWAIAIIFFLDNIGFKISTVIAGLGIGGVAVALAAQAILKDLFSYFSIIFDRPFGIGDFIIIGDYMGTVEYIGAKTTRIRSLSGEQLIFSNTDLTDSRVRNYKRMERRRVVFKLGVTYDTKLELLKEIPAIIERIIKNVSNTALTVRIFSLTATSASFLKWFIT
ncbi:MAG: mechanosensitive ion channel domain-containing protein [Candidatus Omnitrophota bacterium]